MIKRAVSPTVVLAALLLSLGAGCMFQSLTPAARFKEEVTGMNDESRWNRIDLAQQRVAPKYQSQFVAARAKWGKRVQLADLDLVNMQMGEAGKAMSIITLSWYDMDDMTLRSSVIRQQWESTVTRFALVSETVIEGDESIFVAGSPQRAKALATEPAQATPEAAPAPEKDIPAKTASL